MNNTAGKTNLLIGLVAIDTIATLYVAAEIVATHFIGKRKPRKVIKAGHIEPSNTLCNYNELAFDSRGDAEIVLAQMKQHLINYPFLTVAQMYELANVQTLDWTLHNYGWNDLSSASVERSPADYYFINLPKPVVAKWTH